MSKKLEYIELNDEVGEQVRSLAEQMLDDAVELARQPDELDPAVHDMRKQLKKLRALLRLVRDEIGTRTYREENFRLRDLGRRLEGVRTAYVRVNTLDRLLTQVGQPLKSATFRGLREALTQAHESERSAFDPAHWQAFEESLLTSKGQLGEWKIKQGGFAAIESSLGKVYAQGHTALKAALKKPEPAYLHELRKQAKYLRYHLRYLRPLWPRHLAATERSLHDLSDLLGDHRDLYVLQHWLTQSGWPNTSDQERLLLEGAIHQRLVQLKDEALVLAQKLYCEKPADFTERLSCYPSPKS